MIQDNLNKQKTTENNHYPAWFFTNEKINKFLLELSTIKNIKKIFAISGGGDFAFSLLSLLKIEEINLCDIRQNAYLTVDLKITLFKIFNFTEILKILSDYKSNNKQLICKKIYPRLNEFNQKNFNQKIAYLPEKNFIKCLKKSRLWYKDSFWQIKNKNDYLLYLTAEKKYQLLQSQLEKINFLDGDFLENLKLFPKHYYDLIYVSNIFDSQKYNPDNFSALKLVRKKIKAKGSFVVITQNNYKKIKKIAEDLGFLLVDKETHRFNVFSAILGHYAYSFLLFKPLIQN